MTVICFFSAASGLCAPLTVNQTLSLPNHRSRRLPGKTQVSRNTFVQAAGQPSQYLGCLMPP